jgi:adenosylcobinamide-GDP ribazoletransferase
MQNLYLGLKFAFSYFTILPVKFKNSDDLSSKDILGSMLLFLPLVGVVLGILVVGLFYILEPLSWYGAVISAVAYMMLYGFLHSEAVMDVVDAIYASHSGKDAYSIIKDPTVGAMGVLWVFGFTLLKISGIVFLLMHHLFIEFITVLMVSRLALLMLFYTQTFKSEFATQLKASLSLKYLLGAFGLFTVIGFLFAGVPFFTIMLTGLLFSYLITIFIRSKIGFVNGDVLGATLEGVEIILFLGVALWL